MSRVQHSLGEVVFNEGSRLEIKNEPYVLDTTRAYFIFDLVPMGAVRMTRSDRWKTDPHHLDPQKRQRPVVQKYFAFRDLLRLQTMQAGYELGKFLDAVYLVPMPASWSKKKKERMNRMPCEDKPDSDNITKAIKDALKKQDAEVWWEHVEKRWAYKGSIILFL